MVQMDGKKQLETDNLDREDNTQENKDKHSKKTLKLWEERLK